MINIIKKQKAMPVGRHAKKESGYTLLFAMIVASIVLAIGVSLLTISRKEFVLSSSATQSSSAFYEADSGIACAEYWNNNNFFPATFLNSTPSIQCSASNFNSSPPTPVNTTVYECSSNLNDNTTCNDPSLAGNGLPGTLADTGDTYEYTFYVPFSTDGTNNKGCAAVSVEKYTHTDPDLGGVEHVYTMITSQGYNIGWNSTGNCSSPSPKKLERAIVVTY